MDTHLLLIPQHLVKHGKLLRDQSRSMGIHVLAGRGSGKSRLLGRIIGFRDFLVGVPQVIMDSHGATVDNFLDALSRLVAHLSGTGKLSREEQEMIWRRVRYVDMSAKHGHVVPFPIFYRLGNETYNDIASRFLDILLRLDPKLQEAPILGWNAVAKMGRRAGIILAALGGQITEMPRLLDHPEQWIGQLASIPTTQTEVQEAAAFFLRDYIQWNSRERELAAGSLRVKLDPFILDPSMRAMFGANNPGINWQEVVDRRQTVILDLRHELNRENRRFKMLWTFLSFLEFIKHRGLGRHQPVGLIIDELAALYHYDVAAGSPIFAADLDELINIIARNYNVWLTLSHQELFQLDEKSRKTLMTMGTQIIGVTSDFDAALTLGREFIPVDPWRIKRYEKVIVPVPRFSIRSPDEGFDIIELNPVELTVQEQEYLAANIFKNLKPFEFLFRPAKAEGDITADIVPVSIMNFDKNIWVNERLVTQLRQGLNRRNGHAISDLLASVTERQQLLTAPKPKPKPKAHDTLKINEQPATQSQQPGLPASHQHDDDEATFRGDPSEMARIETIIFPPPKKQQASTPVLLPDKSKFTATDRDQDIVCSVFDYRVLSTVQIAWLHFIFKIGDVESVISRCRQRLRNLEEAGFLERHEQEQIPSKGRKPDCFSCTKKACSLWQNCVLFPRKTSIGRR